jgi:hypothetical protein
VAEEQETEWILKDGGGIVELANEVADILTIYAGRAGA